MDIWQVLEIEPTPDTKIIKRAYAKKLKVTRPDEDPQAFQDLHYAYKTALREAAYWEYENNVNDDRNDGDNHDDIHEDNNHQRDENAVELQTPDNIQAQEVNFQSDTEIAQLELPSNQAIDTTPITTSELNPVDNNLDAVNREVIAEAEIETSVYQPPVNPYQVEGERLLGLSELLLSRADNGQNDPKNWAFIIESPFILEDHFNWRLGLELLQLIHQHNLNHAAKVNQLVGQDGLNYLNSIFNWKDNSQHIIRALGEEYSTWLETIREPETEIPTDWHHKIRGGKKITIKEAANSADEKPLATNWQRFAAGFIDLCIITLFIGLLLTEDKNFPFALGFVALAFFYFLFFESSHLSGTIGKRLMGLKVVSQDFQIVKFEKNLIRLIFFFSYILLWCVFAALISIPLPFGGIGVLLYFLYTINKPTTAYDRWSKTRIVRH